MEKDCVVEFQLDFNSPIIICLYYNFHKNHQKALKKIKIRVVQVHNLEAIFFKPHNETNRYSKQQVLIPTNKIWYNNIPGYFIVGSDKHFRRDIENYDKVIQLMS